METSGRIRVARNVNSRYRLYPSRFYLTFQGFGVLYLHSNVFGGKQSCVNNDGVNGGSVNISTEMRLVVIEGKC